MVKPKTGSTRIDRPGVAALLNAWGRNHMLVGNESLARIRRTPLQSGLMIAVIAIAASLPASLYLLAGTVKAISGDVSSTANIQVFFEPTATREQIDDLIEQWSELEDIETIRLIDPETGRQEFEQFSGLGNILDLLGENPLPSVARLTPSDSIGRDRTELDSLVTILATATGVDEVEFDFAWLERLEALLTLVDRINLVMGVMLGLGIVLVLINSIRLMIDNRRDEIIIVKLVGGTNEFVRRPLLYTGFWLGLLGGLVAVFITDLAVVALGNPLDFLLGSYALDNSNIAFLGWVESLSLLVVCATLGLAGAWLAVAQHLKAIEPR